MTEKIDHPKHYGGAENPHEAIKVIEAWRVGFCTGNALKYLSRAGKKDGATFKEDCQKALWYLKRAGAHDVVQPLVRRTLPTLMGPAEIATAWGSSRAIAQVLAAIYLGKMTEAIETLEDAIIACEVVG